VLVANLIGLIPYSFTVTSQLIITVTFALLVFFIVVGYGFWKNGLHFFNLFVPKGVPKLILPAIVAIEVLSFLSRPVSHSVRLFANMLAGHITLQVFSRLRHHARERGDTRRLRRHAAIHPGGLIVRAQASGGVLAGLCVRDSHLHLSQ
jgi:F0F1-type ATP synthase membrane subunit a